MAEEESLSSITEPKVSKRRKGSTPRSSTNKPPVISQKKERPVSFETKARSPIKSIDADDLSSSSAEKSAAKKPTPMANEFMKFLSLDVEVQKMHGHRKSSVVLGKSDVKVEEDGEEGEEGEEGGGEEGEEGGEGGAGEEGAEGGADEGEGAEEGDGGEGGEKRKTQKQKKKRKNRNANLRVLKI